MGLLKIIFVITLILAFPLAEISRINLGNAIGITFLDIGVFLLAATWFLQLIIKRQKVKTKLLIPVSVFTLFALISLLINFGNLKLSEFLVSSLYLIRWVFYAATPFIVMNFDDGFKKKIPNLMLTSGGIIVLGGFVQYLFYSDLRNLRYAGWDEHLFRLFSSFLDPNFAGIFFVLYLLLALNLIFDVKRKLKLNILVLLSFISILLTFSRSAMISLIVGVLTLTILKGEKKISAAIFLGFIISLVLLLNFPLKSEGTNILRIASGEARIDSFNRALTIFKDHPIFGVGFDSYRYAQKNYGFIGKNWESIHSGAGTDNSFLFVLATTGIIGFLAYLYMWRKIIKLSDSSILNASIIAVFVSSLFINSLFYTFIMFWLWVLVGLKKNS